MRHRHSPRYCDRGRRGRAQPATGQLGRRREGRTGSQDTSPSGHFGMKCTVAVASRVTARHRALLASALARVQRRSARATPRSRGETIVVIDERPIPTRGARDRDRALGDAPFVTVVHPDDHPATASVADAVGAAVGAQTRSARRARRVRVGHRARRSAGPHGRARRRCAARAARGGDDGPRAVRARCVRRGRSVSRRGAGRARRCGRRRRAQPRHAARAAASTASACARRSAPARSARATCALHYGDATAALRSSTTVGYQAATGDYTFFSDHGTPLNATDDSYERAQEQRVLAARRLARRRTRIARAAGGAARSRASSRACRARWRSPRCGELATLDVIGDGRGRRARRAGDRAPARRTCSSSASRCAIRAASSGSARRSARYVTLVGRRDDDVVAADRRARGDRRRRAARRAVPRQRRAAAPAASSATASGGALLAAIDRSRAAKVVVTPAVRLDVVRTAPTPMTAGPTEDAGADALGHRAEPAAHGARARDAMTSR